MITETWSQKQVYVIRWVGSNKDIPAHPKRSLQNPKTPKKGSKTMTFQQLKQLAMVQQEIFKNAIEMDNWEEYT